MSRVFSQRLPRSFKIAARKLLRNKQGVAAIEFGLLAPILLLMLLGTIEVSRAVSIDRKFGLVTSVIADLVAREKTITAADVTAMYDVAQHIMKPWDAATLKIAIIPVKANPTNENDTKVYASTTNRPSLNGATQLSKGSAYSLTTGLLEKGSTVIVVQSQYTYTPLFTQTIIGNMTWNDKAILTPRNSCVDFDPPSNCVSGLWAGG
jgi:Flp pilus assembly protein TadG